MKNNTWYRGHRAYVLIQLTQGCNLKSLNIQGEATSNKIKETMFQGAKRFQGFRSTPADSCQCHPSLQTDITGVVSRSMLSRPSYAYGGPCRHINAVFHERRASTSSRLVRGSNPSCTTFCARHGEEHGHGPNTAGCLLKQDVFPTLEMNHSARESRFSWLSAHLARY